MILLERLRVDRFKSLRDIDLLLPPRGSVLVEGLNEAGKSTLFESIYFALYGSLLASEDNRGSLESAIGYGATEATVELAFRVGDTRLVVTRWLRRGRPSRARLRLSYPDGTREEVSQVAAVNRRIVQELGSLEGAALLDSCFVEQKKLEKLEAMDAREREAALLRLLNLDRLTLLERRFRVSRADEQALAAAEARAELAALREIIPQREAEEAALSQALQAAALRRELDALAAQEAAAEEAATTRTRLEQAREALRTLQAQAIEQALLEEWERSETAAEQTAAAAQPPLPRLTARVGALVSGLLLGAGAALVAGQVSVALLLGGVALAVGVALGYRRVRPRFAARPAAATARPPAGVDSVARAVLAARFAVHGLIPPASLAACRARRAALAAAAADAAALLAALAQELEALSPTSDSERALAAVERALGEAVARETLARHEAAARRAAVRAMLTSLGLPAPAELSVATIAPLLPAVTDDPAAAAALAARRDALLTELGALRARRAALERQWSLATTPLDRVACEAEAAALRHELAVRTRAAAIVAAARERLVERVLPDTVRHLQLLLPLLTDGRYRDAVITDDYRLRVWDERAGRYVAKHLFSGGTRDQFSLALRLAFALATLPAERGVRPGFLFLDEPLSSFDARRARAVVALLTTGYVAAHFAQIFVISHGGQFDRHAFPYRLRLADGRIVESNLPRHSDTAEWAIAPLGPPVVDPLALDEL
ncbi:MAG TPA: AAA family ATPase [Chloroflexota bacterium]|nr:AAA family ATPase [Chloroflexota bacterium]